MTRITTKTHRSARHALGRLIRNYQAGQMESQTFRDLIYGMTLLLSYFKHEADLEIEKRLQDVEEALMDKK